MGASVAWPSKRREFATALAVIAGWALLMGIVLWRFPPAGDDAYPHAVFGIEQLHCWRGGVAWPRFHPDWNGATGSFWPAIYSPIALAIQGGATLLTGEGTRAVALALLLATILGAFLVRSGFRSPPVIWWLWLALPYVLVDIFSRATVTEMWALAAAAGILSFALPPGPVRTGKGIALVFLTAFAAGSQPMMLLIVGVPLVVAWLVSVPLRDHASWGRAVAWGTAAVLTAGVFWLPPLLQLGLFDRQALFGGQYAWREHFATSVLGNSELGPALLAIWIAIAAIAAVGAIRLRQDNSHEARAQVFFVAACVLLACPLSAPLWELSGLGVVQFPWRFLGPASVVSIVVLARFPRRLAQALGAVLLVPALLVPIDVDGGSPPLDAGLSGSSLAAACSVRYGIAPILATTPGEYTKGFEPLGSLRSIHRQPATVEMRAGSCCRRTYQVVAPAAGPVLLPVQWWPEWQLSIDGQSNTFVNREGLVAVTVPVGSHTVNLKLGPARARRMGAGITIAGLLAVALLWMRGRRGHEDPRLAGGTREA